jgi:DNA-binding MarR family transcriptional regulator
MSRLSALSTSKPETSKPALRGTSRDCLTSPWQDRFVAAAGDQREPGGPSADQAGPVSARRQLINNAAAEARIQQTAYDRFEDAAAAYVGVNRTAMRCMDVLDQAGQLTPGEIAVQTGLTSGAVTAMLDRLERVGLVQRQPDPSDRRRVIVRLTDKSRQLTSEIYGPLAGEITEFERYSDDELRLIADFLRLGTATLRRHADRVERQATRTGRSRT